MGSRFASQAVPPRPKLPARPRAKVAAVRKVAAVKAKSSAVAAAAAREVGAVSVVSVAKKVPEPAAKPTRPGRPGTCLAAQPKTETATEKLEQGLELQQLPSQPVPQAEAKKQREPLTLTEPLAPAKPSRLARPKWPAAEQGLEPEPGPGPGPEPEPKPENAPKLEPAPEPASEAEPGPVQHSEVEPEFETTVAYDYSSHGTDGHIEVSCGDAIVVQSRTAEWWHVRLVSPRPGGVQSGWMPAAYAQPIDASSAASEGAEVSATAEEVPLGSHEPGDSEAAEGAAEGVVGAMDLRQTKIETDAPRTGAEMAPSQEGHVDAGQAVDSVDSGEPKAQAVEDQEENPEEGEDEKEEEAEEEEDEFEVDGMPSPKVAERAPDGLESEPASIQEPDLDPGEVESELEAEEVELESEPEPEPGLEPELAHVLYDYTSHGTDGHVEVWCGEVVAVEQRPSPDWWFVKTTDEARSGGAQSGWMPAAYLGDPAVHSGSAGSDASEAGAPAEVEEGDLSEEDLIEQVIEQDSVAEVEQAAEQQAAAVAAATAGGCTDETTVTIQRHVRGRLTRARVAKVKKKEYQRRRIVMEILSTETTYNEGLRV